MYRIYPDRLRRAFDKDGEKMLVEVSFSGRYLELKWLVGQPTETARAFIKEFISEWFDLESDLKVFYKLLSAHRALAYMPKIFTGLRFVGMPDLLESLSWAIIGQQINLQFAYKIKRRLVENYGSWLDYEGEKYWLFPTAGKLARTTIPELRELQLSNRKAEYLINIAGLIDDQSLDKTLLRELPDLTARLQTLTAIKGIGIWTANYVLMKTLNERSCVPYGDAGLIIALIGHGLIKDKRDNQGVEDIFRRFPQWEAYLVFYLWRSLAPEGDKKTGKLMQDSK
jgi:DNA-3-methyladenine glycosylase II